MNFHKECTKLVNLKLDIVRLEKTTKIALENESFESLNAFGLKIDDSKNELQIIYKALRDCIEMKLFNSKTMLSYKIFTEYLIDINPKELYYELSYFTNDQIKSINSISENIQLNEEMLIAFGDFGVWFNFFSNRLYDLKIMRNHFLREKNIEALKEINTEIKSINLELFGS